MSDRKKWGVALMITGIVTLAVGVIVFFTPATPDWVSKALAVVTLALNLVGFPLAFVPDPK
jgi:hypothetical protein